MARAPSQPSQSVGSTKAERTRAAVLAAAETCFARQGFAATRLEDVAEAVGIRRASIVYYFKDKRELYEAVLENVLSDLLDRLEGALFGAGAPTRRVEAAVSAWVDYVAERPSFARLLLREVADASPGHGPEELLRQIEPFHALIGRFIAEGGGRELARGVDAPQMASTIAGATLFHVAALPALVPELQARHAARKSLDHHREEMLRLCRRFLRRPTAGSTAPSRKQPQL